jgi:HK97 family phage major capsid protein
MPRYISPAVDDDVISCLPRAHTFVAIRQGATVEMDRSAYFSSDQTALRAIMRIGFGFSFPAAVVKVRFSRPLLAGPTKK